MGFYRWTLKAIEVSPIFSRKCKYAFKKVHWPASYVGVSKNSCTPKWMVKIMENPIKMDDLGVPLFSETPMLIYQGVFSCHSFRSLDVDVEVTTPQAWLWFWSLGGRMEVAVWCLGGKRFFSWETLGY